MLVTKLKWLCLLSIKLASVQVLESSTPIWRSEASYSKDAQTMAQDINIMPGVQEVSVSVSVSYVINQ